MKVLCPHCETIKTIDKTIENKQVRCGKREGGCGERFYIKENIVLEKETIGINIETNKTERISIFITPQGFMAKVLKMLVNDLNTTLLEDKKKRLINVLTARDKRGNNYAWIRDSLMIFIDYCIQKGLIGSLEEDK